MPRKQNPEAREVRTVALTGVEVRTDAADSEIRVTGHASVTDRPAWIGPKATGFSERFAPGAWTKTVKDGADVRFLFNHDPNHVLARTANHTLKLGEDPDLTIDATLAQTSTGRDLAILMERGDVDQMSVGMEVVRDKWESVRGGDGSTYEQRTILEAKLFDVSAVTFPAYEETDISMAQRAREIRDARGGSV
jgi:HK97 family phage prohead protease